jgi:hypothetical protein
MVEHLDRRFAAFRSFGERCPGRTAGRFSEFGCAFS